MQVTLISLLVCAVAPVVYTPGLAADASSDAGARYGPAMAVDGNPGTRWACANHAPLPQWLKVRLPGPSNVDTVALEIPADHLYSAWKEVELTFSKGDPLGFTLEPDQTAARFRFEPRETEFLRVTIRWAHEQKNYVGLKEILMAYDEDEMLSMPRGVEHALKPEELVIRGRQDHPCVNVTAEDVRRALGHIERYPWAQHERDRIIQAADVWLRESDDYWLSFLPEPGACYAYGFTGCPICNGRTGTWAGARCAWDNPGHVTCENGHVLPDAEHPDDGAGYLAPDGRVHYLVGQFNAWVTEQWTLKALPNLAQAYLLTGDEGYARRGALLLDALASIYSESTSGSWDYPSDPPSGRFARPWYQVARTLVYYVDQYDFLHRSAALDGPSLRPGMTRRENIEKHLLLDGAYYCYRHSFDGALHNGHADYMRGALAVGCLLDIPEYVRISVEGPFSIHAMLANNIDRDGRYYETALGYAIHARDLYLTFADPLINLRNAEYPQGINLYDDPKFQSCLLLPELQVSLAGRLPNFGDAAPDYTFKPFSKHPFSAVDYGYLERLYALATDPEKRTSFGAALQYLAQGDLDRARDTAKQRNWLLWHARDPKNVEAGLPDAIAPRVIGSWMTGMKGLALLRGDEQAALLRFGPSLNHGDRDDLGLLYYGNGYELSYDIGYGLGSTHCHVGWASSTVSHCIVTVNEKNQLEGDGSGGSLRYFGDLPGVKVVEATSENSYSSEGVSEYRRTVALVTCGKYLVDVFRVAGGHQHEYGFGSIGPDLEPFGVANLTPHEGSLAEGVAWGEQVGPDGDIQGYPNKPYWNPPPGNGYGFFYNVRRGRPRDVWGGVWSIGGDGGAKFRVHVLGDEAEAIFATAPGLYPSKPLSSYVIARRTGEDLRSTFIAVYEPFEPRGIGLGEDAGLAPRPAIETVRRLSRDAVQVHRFTQIIDVLLFGSCAVDSALGAVVFEGDFAFLTGDAHRVQQAQVVGCNRLEVNGEKLDPGPGAIEATVQEVDLEARAVTVDVEVPSEVEGLVAVFSNPAYSRTTAYHVRAAHGQRIALQANSLSLGNGRVLAITGPKSLTSDIPHEYAKSVNRARSTRFFDGKCIRGAYGGVTRIISTTPGSPLGLEVEDATVFQPHETFQYLDLVPGDHVRIPLVRAHESLRSPS